LPHNANGWKVLFDDKQVGLIASAAWSPDFRTNVAIGMIDRDYWDPGSVLQLDTGADIRSIEVQDKFWI
jgi:dimethylsulfoniopropionate demethylase